ncbi:MAG TPA: nucleoid-associated protein [Chryseolinea sp.]|nr:nucleoid-associated protein [Chryseolinea sp.]
MVDFAQAELTQVSIHWVGNKLLEESLSTSSESVSVTDEDTTRNLLTYFLSSFKDEETYNLDHPTDLKQNQMYAYANRIFKDDSSFHDLSIEIAKHLHACSVHPKIEGGDLWVSHFSGCIVDGKRTNVLGVFRSGAKTSFLKTRHQKGIVKVNSDEGIAVNKLEKGCLIFNLDKQDGFRVLIVDTRKAVDGPYWKADFLQARTVVNSFSSTKNALLVAKEFVTKELVDEFDLSKTDQIDILNRSMDYFKDNNNFNKNEFEKQVFADKNYINSFRKFDDSFRKENAIEFEDEFDISSNAVKKQARIFKSVLKLDKNFHIYIHGNKNLIEKGQERDGRKFYKIYYDEES